MHIFLESHVTFDLVLLIAAMQKSVVFYQDKLEAEVNEKPCILIYGTSKIDYT